MKVQMIVAIVRKTMWSLEMWKKKRRRNRKRKTLEKELQNF